MQAYTKSKRIKSTRATLAAAALIASVFAAFPAAAADTPSKHLRGTITQVNDDSFSMKTTDGKMREVAIGSSTGYAGVVKSSLDQVKQGTFIGTANVKRDGNAQALEVVVFPESMKGTGLGDYPWDLSPSQVRGGSSDSGSGMQGGSDMTNGTVKSTDQVGSGFSMGGGGGSDMTNGTVTQASGSSQMSVKVDYGDGSKTIQIPSDVPVVAVQKGSKSDLKSGAHVFVVGPQGSDPFQAGKVMVGIDGTVPPM